MIVFCITAIVEKSSFCTCQAYSALYLIYYIIYVFKYFLEGLLSYWQYNYDSRDHIMTSVEGA